MMTNFPQFSQQLMVYMASAKTLLEKLNPFLAIFILYLITESNNLSITHDSINYYALITADRPEFNPNHLLFIYILSIAIKPFELIFSSAQSLQILQALFGALTLHLFYRILVQRFQVDRLLATGIVLICTFTYGIWYYSVTIEIYIYPMSILLMAFLILTRQNATTTTVLTAASLHSFATLIHQSSILFSGVVVVALLANKSHSFPIRVKHLILYTALCAILVGGTYWAIGSYFRKADTLIEFVSWLPGRHQGFDDISFGLKSLFLAFVGFARAIVGLNYIFAHEQSLQLVNSMFSAQTLADEIYLVRNFSDKTFYLLLTFSVVACFCFISMFYYAAQGFVQQQTRKINHHTLLLLVWLVPHVFLATSFNPENADLWLMQVILVLALLGIGMNKLNNHRKRSISIIFTMAALLLVVNGLGTVLPAHNPDNDLYRTISTQYSTQLGDKEDKLIIADKWPLKNHIKHYSDIRVYDLITFFQTGIPVKSAYRILRKLEPDTPGTVYFAPDMLHIPPSTEAEYGPEFTDYVKQFADYFCEPEMLTLDSEVSIYKLDCI